MKKTLTYLITVFILLATTILPGACSSASEYTLTTSADPAAGGTVSPGGTYPDGENVRITATPNAGYAFDGWSGGATGASTSTTITMDSNKTVIAHFIEVETEAVVLPTYLVDIDVTPAEGGTVTPDGGTFEEGTAVTFTANPFEGYRFSAWGGDASGIQSTITLTVDENLELFAYFEKLPEQKEVVQYLLTTMVDPANGGIVTPSNGKYNSHAKVTATASAADGYIFLHWEGDVSGTNPEIVFNMDSDVTIKAVFEEDSGLTLTSTAFVDDADIPVLYSCEGDDISPPLAWRGIPHGTVSFVLIVDDPDAPNGTFTHWILYNIPADVRSLESGIPVDFEFSDGTIQGINNFAEYGYGGPCPPQGSRHQYRFTLYALDRTIILTKYQATRTAVLAAIEPYILDQTQLSGYFSR